MKNTRVINTKFWSDGFISELNPLDRYLFLYFITNERTNLCGIYEIPIKLMSAETGLEVDMIKKMLRRLSGKIYYKENYIILINFVNHQVLKSADLVKGIFREFEEKPLNIRCFAVLKGYPVDKIGGKIEDYPYTLPTPSIEEGGSAYTKKHKVKKLKVTKYKEKEIISSEQSSQVQKVLEIFYKINPTLNWGNKTNRSAAAEMIKKFGLDATLKMAQQIVDVQGEQYAPVATNPYKMKEKLAEFKIYFDKEKNNGKKPLII